MKKGMLQDGRPMFRIKVEHFVKWHDFAKALACFYWAKSEVFPLNLKKKEAMEILSTSLFHYGLHGELDTTLWEGSGDGLNPYNDLYDASTKWVGKNYPYLIPVQ